MDSVAKTKNYELRTTNSKAFTLVEILIVTAILGILAAIVIPEFQSHATQAKEAAAKENLRILRDAIERYANDHNGVAPGYLSNNPALTPTAVITVVHLKTYLSTIPKNPINNLNTILVLRNSENFPATANESTGWIYKPSTKTVRFNSIGTDSNSVSYYDY
jgi:prepilin-type N-terminal cleavage/methylation domain-containing protein